MKRTRLPLSLEAARHSGPDVSAQAATPVASRAISAGAWLPILGCLLIRGASKRV
jgi:hypothetical protein